jgi:pimeloyl-ACP methyl ester carboxylesterase
LSGAAAASETEPTLRIIEANGIKMRIAEMGKGPLVLFLHGFPESWYSWRHQLPALAKAGYRAVAPDLRGYGKSDKPPAVEDYDIRHLAADAVGILDALGEKTAVLVGHDWGSIIAWNTIMMYPDRFTALVPMSVPYSGRPPVSPLETMKKAVGDNFFYIVYFQEPGAAEAEFDKEPREFLSRIYPAVAADLTPDSPRDPPEITDPRRSAGLDRRLPRRAAAVRLTQKDLDYYGEFTMRFPRRDQLLPERVTGRSRRMTVNESHSRCISSLASGHRDRGANTAAARRWAALDRFSHHVIQAPALAEEKAAETNAAIVAFLASLTKSKAQRVNKRSAAPVLREMNRGTRRARRNPLVLRVRRVQRFIVRSALGLFVATAACSARSRWPSVAARS